MVEHLPSTGEALGSLPGTPRKKQMHFKIDMHVSKVKERSFISAVLPMEVCPRVLKLHIVHIQYCVDVYA